MRDRATIFCRGNYYLAEESLWEVLSQNNEIDLDLLIGKKYFGDVAFGSSSSDGYSIGFSKGSVKKVLENCPVTAEPGHYGSNMKHALTREQYLAALSTIKSRSDCPQNSGDIAYIFWKGHCLYQNYLDKTL